MNDAGDDRRLDDLLARALPPHGRVEWQRLRQRITTAVADDDARRDHRLDELLADVGLTGSIDWTRQRRRVTQAAAQPAGSAARPAHRWRMTAVAIGLAAAASLLLPLVVPGPRPAAPAGFARVTLVHVSDPVSSSANGFARVALSGPEEALRFDESRPQGEMFLMIQPPSTAPGASRTSAGA